MRKILVLVANIFFNHWVAVNQKVEWAQSLLRGFHQRKNKRRIMPFHLKKSIAIMISISRSHVLAYYTNLFWPGLVLLNEVYPEPAEDELKIITEKGCSAYHVVGIQGKAYPSFANAYAGGIPCCAARISGDMQVIVKKLN